MGFVLSMFLSWGVSVFLVTLLLALLSFTDHRYRKVLVNIYNCMIYKTYPRIDIMDNFSKAALSIIAVTLIFIATQAYQISASLSQPPTVGDYLALRDIKDATVKKEALKELINHLPLIRVKGGSIYVSGDVDVTGSVDCY